MSIRFKPGFLAALVILTIAGTAGATDYTWTGNTSGVWTTTSNWSPGSGYPNAATDTVLFSGANNPAVTLNGNKTVGAITFGPGATTGFTVSSNRITLKAGGSIVKSANAVVSNQTISSNLTLQGDATFTNNNWVHQANKLTIRGTISGSGTIHIAGTGNGGVELSGNNTGFTGSIVMDSGMLLVSNNNALGTTAGSTTINGGDLWFSGGINTYENFIFAGNSSQSSLDSCTISGNIQVNPGATWTVTNGGGNAFSLSGAITGSGNIAMPYANTTLGGSTSNTLSGTISLTANSSSATYNQLTLNKSGGALAVSGPLDIQNKGTVVWNGDNQVADTAPISLEGGKLLINGHSDAMGTLTLGGVATLDMGNGTGLLSFANSSSLSWSSKALLSIDNYTLGSNHLYIGSSSSGLTIPQLSQVRFESPAGKTAGIYTAKITSAGELVPDQLYVPPPSPGRNPNFNLVPYPRSLQDRSGQMALGATSRIVVGSADLGTLGGVLSNEIYALTGTRLAVTTGAARDGDIVLQSDSSLTGEKYSLDVQKQALVKGGSYRGLAEATVTLLQSLKNNQGSWSVPTARIDDNPDPGTAFRSTMVDLARNTHSVDTLKQMIELNRLYKVPYMHLHLTDDHGFTFPTAVAGVNGHNWTGLDDPRQVITYTTAQLQDLVSFADARGVTLIPEIDVPGHASQLVTGRPDLFKIGNSVSNVINIANPAAVSSVESILSEVAGIFQSSPYIHIGGDEVDLSYLNRGAASDGSNVFTSVRQQWDAKMDALTIQMRAAGRLGATDQINNAQDVMRDFFNELNTYIKGLGKSTLIWEGFGAGGVVPVDKDITVMSWSNGYYNAQGLVQDGYKVINGSWVPLYSVRRQRYDEVTTLADLYKWTKEDFQTVDGTGGMVVSDQYIDDIVGAQLCSWETIETLEISSLRDRLAAMSEKTWDPDSQWSYEDFNSRLASTDGMLDQLFTANDMALPEVVPEPGALSLLVLSTLAVMRRRRK